MGKGKLVKFAEMSSFQNVLQPSFNEVFNHDFYMKGKWASGFFHNDNPIVLELGCGKGEYSLGLAELYPERNFIGVDIKGARIWKGAKRALNEKKNNVAFLRTRIDIINSFFNPGEVSELWITFPDPQPKKYQKRLTSGIFLNRYRKLLINGGFINLKTDNKELFEYTRQLVEYNELKIEYSTTDLYNSGYDNEILSIKTFYEMMWLQSGLPIHYIRFKLNTDKNIEELPDA